MARRFAALMLAFLVTACATGLPRVNLALEEQAVRARGAEMMTTENARDFAKALTFYAPNAVVQPPGRPALAGVDAIRAMYEQQNAPGMPAVKGAFRDRVISVAASGDLAWEHGTANTTIMTPMGERVLNSKQLMVWRKIGGQWLLAAMSFSGDGPPR